MGKSRSNIKPSINPRKKSMVDRISNLPDDILYRILSLMPTKYAVGTSVLSHRWKFLWTSIPVLLLDDRHYFNVSPKKGRVYEDDEDVARNAFMDFVRKVVSRNNSPNIEIFRLNYTDYDAKHLDCVNDCMRNVISRNVIELDLHLDDVRKYFDESVTLQLLPCDSLRVLKIQTCFPMRIPTHPECFKNLKKFYFHFSFWEPDSELTGKLFSSLPQLEELLIEGHYLSDEHYDKPVDLNIIAPSLKRLQMRMYCGMLDGNFLFKILIDAPQLEFISILDDYVQSYLVKNHPSDFDAKIKVGKCSFWKNFNNDDWKYGNVNRALEVIRGLSSAKSLTVSKSTIWILNFADDDNLPMLPCLRKLDASIVYPCCWNLLLHFLANAPNLENLILTVRGCSIFGPQDSDGWSMPESLPTCLTLNLKEVELKPSRFPKSRLEEMSAYFIENAKVLKKLIVDDVMRKFPYSAGCLVYGLLLRK